MFMFVYVFVSVCVQCKILKLRVKAIDEVTFFLILSKQVKSLSIYIQQSNYYGSEIFVKNNLTPPKW